MKRLLLFVLVICAFPNMSFAQYGYISYPMKAHMFGIVGGVFLTSNPDMSAYDTKKNYVDGGGGLVYDYRNDGSDTWGLVGGDFKYADIDECPCEITTY